LFESKKFQSEKKSKHHYILVDTLNVLRELQKNGSGYSFEEMEQLKLDFYKHLERNPSSEILDKLNGIYACLEKYTSKIEILNIHFLTVSVFWVISPLPSSQL
jgi:predicted RecB family nuclease